MLKLLFNKSENAMLMCFPNMEVMPWLLMLSDSAARTPIVTGAVFLVHCRCGVLPQPLDCICDISDALDATALASTWRYDLVSQSSHCRSSDLSSARFESSSTTRWVDIVGERPGVFRRWCGWPRYVASRAYAPFVLMCLIFS